MSEIVQFYANYLINSYKQFHIDTNKERGIVVNVNKVTFDQLLDAKTKKELVALKKNLNKFRKLKETLYSTIDKKAEDIKLGYTFDPILTPYDNRTMKQYYTKKYNLDQALYTNAFRKLYEILIKFPELIKKNNNNSRSELKVFDICGFPGAFTYAIHYYCKVHTNISKIDWYIQSLNPNYNKKISNRQKSFNSKIVNNSKILFGEPDGKNNGSGDITDIKNINYYKNFFKNNKRDLIVSDCGQKVELNEAQEDILIDVNLGQIITTLYCLKKGGCFVMKTFQTTTQMNLSLYALLSMCFEKMYIVKPVTSRITSNERYVVLINYFDNLDEDEFHILIETLQKQYKKKSEYSFIDYKKFNKLNPNFFNDLIKIENDLDDTTINHVKKYFKFYDLIKYDLKSIKGILRPTDISYLKVYEKDYKYKQLHNKF